MNTYTFLITSLIIILIPGTGVIYTISTGITEGKRKSLLAAVGCTLGIIPHLCISIAMSSLLMQLSNTVFVVIRLMGVVYLLYLGVGMIFSKSKIEFAESNSEHSPAAIVIRGILINLLNPKLTLFFFSFLPQYLSADRQNYLLQGFFLGLAFMFITLIVFCCYGYLAGVAKSIFLNSHKRVSILQKCFGCLFIGFALKLAIDI